MRDPLAMLALMQSMQGNSNNNNNQGGGAYYGGKGGGKGKGEGRVLVLQRYGEVLEGSGLSLQTRRS